MRTSILCDVSIVQHKKQSILKQIINRMMYEQCYLCLRMEHKCKTSGTRMGTCPQSVLLGSVRLFSLVYLCSFVIFSLSFHSCASVAHSLFSFWSRFCSSTVHLRDLIFSLFYLESNKKHTSDWNNIINISKIYSKWKHRWQLNKRHSNLQSNEMLTANYYNSRNNESKYKFW